MGMMELGFRPLDDARRRLEAVLNNASVAIFLMDDRQQCVYMNPAAERLTGYTFEEVLALDRPLHDIVHHTRPDGRPFPLHECRIDRAFPEHNQMRGEEMFVHKNGKFYPVAFTASPIRDEDSKTIGTIIEVRDIREEKLAQERQKFLVNELNHRVKNTLATVQSLAWQTFKDTDEEALNRFNGRLSTLSKAHKILTEADWHETSLRETIFSALEPFALSRIEIDGHECGIDHKAAVSLSMVLHELGTNAIKYGALSIEGGRVLVRWTCQPKGDQIGLDLLWQEQGGPAVAPPQRRGFGTRLIERQIGMEFGGTAALDFKPDGLICAMKLNLPRNTDPMAM